MQHEMEGAAAAFYAELEAAGTPPRYTHRQSEGVQWRYSAWLAGACGPGVCAFWGEGGRREGGRGEAAPPPPLPPPPPPPHASPSADVPPPSPWRVALYEATGESKRADVGRYRDLPLPGVAQAQAQAEAELGGRWHEWAQQQQLQGRSVEA